MDEITKERVIEWEAGTLAPRLSMAMVATLMKSNELWVLKGEPGRIATILLMLEESESERH